MTQLFPTFPVSVKPPYWEYFLAIEDDLLQTSRYVEFTESNFHVHSIEFARLLLISGSEVDVIAKELCKLLSSSLAQAEDGWRPYGAAAIAQNKAS